MSQLQTATGKLYPCNFMGAANEFVLFLRVNMEIMDIMNIFQDPEETSVMRWIGDNGDVVRTETGFTEFTGFSIVKDECPFRIRMTKKIVGG